MILNHAEGNGCSQQRCTAGNRCSPNEVSHRARSAFLLQGLTLLIGFCHALLGGLNQLVTVFVSIFACTGSVACRVGFISHRLSPW